MFRLAAVALVLCAACAGIKPIGSLSLPQTGATMTVVLEEDQVVLYRHAKLKGGDQPIRLDPV